MEFDNEVQFGEFCNGNGITHNFSAPRIPQSNSMVERKNKTLQEKSSTMLNEQSLPQKFWCNVVDTSTYILNQILIRVILGKTPYELLRGRKPTFEYFRVFGSKCFILKTKDYLTKFDPKSYEGVFLGYSQNSKAYIILNKDSRKIKESLNVTFDETPPPSKTSPLVDDDLDEEEAIKITENKNLENDIEDETLEIDKIANIKESRNHPLKNVIGNLNQITLSWIIAMQEELNQFIANDVWELVPQPRNMTIIRTELVFRNKLDKNGIVSQNKARLVAQGYNQQEGIDYDETYALVARLESIRILLAYACALDFKVFQMDVKSAFLNGFINEEGYVAQPMRFINFKIPDHVYKLKKALYGLKQAPKALFNHVVSIFPELAIDRYILYDRVMHPLAPHYERKMRSDHGTKRCPNSNPSSSSTALNHSSSSHNIDENVDDNDKESSYSSTPSLPQLINPLSNVVPRVFENLPHESQSLNSYQTEIINHQIQHRYEHRKGLRSIGKALKDMMKKRKHRMIPMLQYFSLMLF
ncbi:retrovirus-related pol polyprotein from transposon TNT 1-94 [Tanacetum coccineum]